MGAVQAANGSGIAAASAFRPLNAVLISSQSCSASAALRRRPFRTIGASPSSSVIFRNDSFSCSLYAFQIGWFDPISSAPPSIVPPGTRSRKLRTRPPTRLRASSTVTSEPARDSSYAGGEPGEAGADDDDARGGWALGAGEPIAEKNAGRGSQRPPEHLTPIDRFAEASVEARVEGSHGRSSISKTSACGAPVPEAGPDDIRSHECKREAADLVLTEWFAPKSRLRRPEKSCVRDLSAAARGPHCVTPRGCWRSPTIFLYLARPAPQGFLRESLDQPAGRTGTVAFLPWLWTYQVAESAYLAGTVNADLRSLEHLGVARACARATCTRR